MSLDADMVNIIGHLFFNGEMDDPKNLNILHCYHDTIAPLRSEGVVQVNGNKWSLAPGVTGFLKLANATLSTFPPKDWILGSRLADPLDKNPPPPFCFVAMPYSTPWHQQVRVVLEEAAVQAGYTFDISKDLFAPGAIMKQVWDAIRNARAVLADLTGLNANVLYEVGIADALGKPVILITQDTGRMPFDVQGNRTNRYDLGQPAGLKVAVTAALKAILEATALRS